LDYPEWAAAVDPLTGTSRPRNSLKASLIALGFVRHFARAHLSAGINHYMLRRSDSETHMLSNEANDGNLDLAANQNLLVFFPAE
jgi:hypothetical protein